MACCAERVQQLGPWRQVPIEEAHLRRLLRQGLDEIKTATRILMALGEKHAPDPADIRMLHAFIPHLGDKAPDELAYCAIHEALRQRAEVRGGLAHRIGGYSSGHRHISFHQRPATNAAALGPPRRNDTI
jgi:hypothetical protein